MNTIISYICCLGRSEKNLNWDKIIEIQSDEISVTQEVNSSTSGS